METNISGTTMTTYEKWALIISIIAILIPIGQLIWKRYVIRARLNHYQTGYGYLFINQSGSYIRLQSVFEAVNKPISIKHIALSIERKSDNQKKNFTWSCFTSPVNMQFVGNSASAVEIAHPFRIEANNVYCAFLEYADQYQNAYRQLTPFYTALYNIAMEYKKELSYDKALEKYVLADEYIEAKENLEKEFFWKIDKYKAELSAKYGNKEKKFVLKFDVNNEQYSLLRYNMKESLLVPLKEIYGLKPVMQVVTVTIEE